MREGGREKGRGKEGERERDREREGQQRHRVGPLKSLPDRAASLPYYYSTCLLPLGVSSAAGLASSNIWTQPGTIQYVFRAKPHQEPELG